MRRSDDFRCGKLAGVLGLLSFCFASVLGAETLVGRVIDRSGAPVAEAVVRVDGVESEEVTNELGEFELVVRLPAQLTVEHPEHATQVVSVAGASTERLEIVLPPRRNVVAEEIAVSASRSQGSFSPQSVSASVLTPDASLKIPRAAGDLVAEAPGVSQNGQGGLFQTYSVRGVSRQRVLTLIEGMRIVSERRAGVSASFIDPLLLGSVEVVRGPSSTYWGSGALGGVVQLFPRRFEELSLALGLSSAGDERFVRLGQGGGSEGDSWSWGLAAREAGLDETPGGLPLFSGFEQVSATFSRRWTRAAMTYEAVVLSSIGNDIGKSNTDFPERTTTYPSENHTLVHLAASHERGWRFEAWTHPNELETRVATTGEGVQVVKNRALDWGLDVQREVTTAAGRTLRWGADFFARQGVDAREESRDLDGRVVLRQQTLSSASEHELGLYGAVEARVERDRARPVTLLAGGRLVYQGQGNQGAPSTEDSAATAFFGAVVPLAASTELTANLGTGLRFPSVSERYFTGTTGRGFVTGNQALEPESSFSIDTGLRWVGDRVFLSGSIFRNQIDDYIERIETEPGRLTFVNLSSGRIQGLELEGGWQPAGAWSLTFGGHAIEGTAEDGSALADVPAERLFVGGALERGAWAWRSRWERRFSKSDVGSGEKPIPRADLVAVSVEWDIRPGLRLSLALDNALDEEYFNAADRRLPLAPARSISVALAWR